MTYRVLYWRMLMNGEGMICDYEFEAKNDRAARALFRRDIRECPLKRVEWDDEMYPQLERVVRLA